MVSTSLNTLKNHSQLISHLEFRRIDDLRKCALLAINTSSQQENSSTTPKSKDIKDTLNELRRNNITLKEDLIRSTCLIYDILSIAKRYISKLEDAELHRRASKEFEAAINSNPRNSQRTTPHGSQAQ